METESMVAIHWVNPDLQTEIVIKNLKWDFVRWRWMTPENIEVDITETAPFEFTSFRTFKAYCRVNKNVMFVQFDSNVFVKIYIEESETIVARVEAGFVMGDGDQQVMYEFYDDAVLNFHNMSFISDGKCKLFRV